ncbi:muellerian-inhibiting factor isoform X2 [Dendropsophus ebraccatus]|uniref:muellerian-inhibiting factor isoform X2 n=1 Tax=Dendropsophus ebraccatus TaxID=150705 RepID=UPI0038318E9E
MGIFRICFCFLFPLLCQTLPSNVNERKREFVVPESQVLADDLSHQDHINIKDATMEFSGSECGKNLGSKWGNLETHGFLREYEIGFLDKMKQKQWEDLGLFGICREESQAASKEAVNEFARFIAEPEGKQLVVLQLEKVDWELGASFQFQGNVRHHIPLLQHLHLLIAVFYPDAHNLTMGSQVTVSGDAVPQRQVVCLSSETRYVVVTLHGKLMNIEPENLRLNTSFQITKYSDGSVLSTSEATWPLFGVDQRCFTKITPVIFMVLSHNAPLIRSGHIFPVTGVHNQMINSKDEFLETLSHFSTLLMTSHTKPSSTIHVSIDPNDESAGDLRPQMLNVTEAEALEWLVDSQEPLVFLFLPGSKHPLANRIQERLNGTLLERITEKTQEVLEDMKDIFSTGNHIQILHKLINSCHSHFNVSYLSINQETSAQLGNKEHRKLHSLMLLKTLQTIRAYWRERKKLSRQNRGAGLKHHCRLQELTINLKPHAEYKDIHFPEEININNCVGPCRFPQTTQSNYQAHVILLIQLQERRQSGLDRPPCCVPVQYQEQWLMVAHKNDFKLHLYPNMVAKECGCR